MTTYQNIIVDALKSGAKLCCTEGENYKCWLVHPDGRHQNIRRDSAEIICQKYDKFLIFGNNNGILWKRSTEIS